MTTIMSSSNSSFKRVVDKAQDDDDCQWLDAKLSVQEEDLNGPDVEGYEEPIEQAAGWDLKAQALSSTSQDKMTAGIKSPSIQGRGEAAVVERNSLRQHSIQTCNPSPATTAASLASSEAPIDRFQRVLVDGHPKPKTTAAARSDSILGWLRQSCTSSGSTKSLAADSILETKSSSSQAAEAAFDYEFKAPWCKPDDLIRPRYSGPRKTQVHMPVEVDDWHDYVTVFGTVHRNKQRTLCGRIKKQFRRIVVGIVIGLAMLTGMVHQGGGGSSQVESHGPSFGFASAPTISTQATLPTGGWNDGIKAQGRARVVSSKFVNSTKVSRVVAPFNIPFSPPSSQALAIVPFPTQSALPGKIEDWIPTLSSTMPWKDRSESEDNADKAVAIIQDSSSSISGAPSAMWKLAFEFFELEETGDVHVGIDCDTDFTGAYDTSKILYGGPAPLFFKSRTVAHNEVTLVHSVDWHTGLPLITVGFGLNRFDRITIVCGDMPSDIAPQATETDAPSNDSTSLALFQGPTDIATFAKGFPSVQAVPVSWVRHLSVGDPCVGKALIVWRPSTTKQDTVSESKALQFVDGKVKPPTGSQAFVVTFDVFLLQGRASLDIHLECVYKNTMPIGLESTTDNPQLLFLSHTFSKHQVNVSVRRSGNQSLVTIGFWEDEFGITAICEDFDAIGSSSAEEAQATGMTASQQQPEPPASKVNSVCCGLKLLLILALCGMALAVKQIPKRRIDQAPPRQAAPSDQVPSHPAAPSVQVPCQRATSSAHVPCQGAAPSYASSSKKAKPLGILKPRIRKVNTVSIRFDKKVTVRNYHRTVGVAPTTSYALALDWTFAEGKATMASFGHRRTANGEACHIPTDYERRNILMEAGLADDKLERLEDRARALCNDGVNRHGT